MLLLLALLCASASGSAAPFAIDGTVRPEQLVNRPQLLPYDPTASAGAAVLSADGMARFTVLTDRLIRMEYAKIKGRFEDRASLAVLHRHTAVPRFTNEEVGGVLTIKTTAVVLTYTNANADSGSAASGFTAESLQVKPLDASTSSFPGWSYGQVRGENGDDKRICVCVCVCVCVVVVGCSLWRCRLSSSSQVWCAITGHHRPL